MYVRKFEADSLDEALKSIKRELGPDAIILKTVTNKGLKGAFKKNRVEITAAISEKSYTKKAKVDNVLDDDNREKFYQNDSGYISKMIEGHARNGTPSQGNPGAGGYSNLGLNKQVQSVKELGGKMKSSLDDFLSGGIRESQRSEQEQFLGQEPQQLDLPRPSQVNSDDIYRAQMQAETRQFQQEQQSSISTDESIQIVEQRKKIDQLEKRLYELTKSVERLDKQEPFGLYQLRTTLRSLSINETTIGEILKKASFELSEDEQKDVDVVFEFALREMLERIPTAMPKFSSLEGSESPCLTILVSDSSCGQTSMLYKLGALQKDSRLIQYQPGQEKSFTETMFDLKIDKVTTISEVVSSIRKAHEKGESVLVDYRNNKTELNDTKKFIDGVRRAFGNVEVLICLSAIHSEIYNRKVASTYEILADGLIVTHLDLCLNYGALFNICEEHPGLPMKFFGTGEVVPEDIESATGERILAGMFKLN
jgi:flagellar biosynthesis protein FlhF